MIVLKLEFADGASAWILNGRLSFQKRRRSTIFGEHEALVFDDYADQKLTRHAFFWKSQPDPSDTHLKEGRPLAISSAPPLAQAIREFIRGIQGKPSRLFGLHLAIQVIRVLEAADQSLKKEGQPIRLSP